ncbi:uncharacterized protein [Dermacentor andersoni]|uniref:uncharacterized protein n=1 Tax=Dermacentor andersoni TaxID=34620 RepID=UPI003B3AF983
MRHKLTTAYHLQTNGLTEHFNHTLTTVLSMYVSSDHCDWDSTSPYVTFAYNSSRHDTAGFPPFHLLFDRHPTLPFETLLTSPVHPVTDYARNASSRAAMARQIARDRISASQLSQKAHYDCHYRVVNYSLGSLVLLWMPCRHVGLSIKLLSCCSGPYKVLRQITDVTYEIAPLDI